MRRRLPSLSLLAAFALLLASCAGPGGPEPLPSLITGSNGFAARHGSAPMSGVNFAENSGTMVWDSTKRMSTLTLTGSSSFAKLASAESGDHAITLKISLVGHATGSSAWIDLRSATNGPGATLTIDSTVYRALSGTTAVTAYGAVGEKVNGVFFGLLRSDAGDTIAISEGFFSVPRAADILVPEHTIDNWIVVSGEGLNNFKIDLCDASGAMGSVYANYVSLLVPKNTTLIAPGVSGSVALTIDYPRLYPGSAPWGTQSHSQVSLRIDERYYSGQTGITDLTYLGGSFMGSIAGTLYGDLVNTKTGAKLRIVAGGFLGWRSN